MTAANVTSMRAAFTIKADGYLGGDALSAAVADYLGVPAARVQITSVSSTHDVNSSVFAATGEAAILPRAP